MFTSDIIPDCKRNYWILILLINVIKKKSVIGAESGLGVNVVFVKSVVELLCFKTAVWPDLLAPTNCIPFHAMLFLPWNISDFVQLGGLNNGSANKMMTVAFSKGLSPRLKRRKTSIGID